MFTRTVGLIGGFYADPRTALETAEAGGRGLRQSAVLLATLVFLGFHMLRAQLAPAAPASDPASVLLFLALFIGPLLYTLSYLLLMVDAYLLSALFRFVGLPLRRETALACSALFLLGSLPVAAAFFAWVVTQGGAVRAAPFEITSGHAFFNAIYIVLIAWFLSRVWPRLGLGGALGIAIAVALAEFVINESVDLGFRQIALALDDSAAGQ